MTSVDLWVDFNELDERNELSSLVEYLSPGVPMLQVGSEITVGDTEGNSSQAQVTAVDDGVIVVALRGQRRRAGASSVPLANRELLDA